MEIYPPKKMQNWDSERAIHSSRPQIFRSNLRCGWTILLAEQSVGEFAPSAVDFGQSIDLMREMEEKFLGI